LGQEDPDWPTKLGPVGDALRSWRAEIIASLGGDEAISAQEHAVVDDENVPVCSSLLIAGCLRSPPS
jgi:hypothetical protein